MTDLAAAAVESSGTSAGIRHRRRVVAGAPVEAGVGRRAGVEQRAVDAVEARRAGAAVRPRTEQRALAAITTRVGRTRVPLTVDHPQR